MSTGLFAHVLFKVLVAGHVDADATVLEPLGLDLVCRVRHRGHDHVRLREALLQRQRAWVHDVPRVVPRRTIARRVARLLWAFGVFLDRSGGWNLGVSGARRSVCVAARQEWAIRMGTHLDGVDVDGEDARAVVREQRRKWTTYDLGPGPRYKYE